MSPTPTEKAISLRRKAEESTARALRPVRLAAHRRAFPGMKKEYVRIATVIVDAEIGAILKPYRITLQHGYPRFYRDGKSTMVHDFVIGKAPSGLVVDHINRNPLDNRKKNLRVVTKLENSQNRYSHRGSSSVFRGVAFRRESKKWRAYGRVDKKLIHLGQFDTEQEAGTVAKAFRLEHLKGAVD